MMKGVFVAGTDTEVGKTIVAACLVAALGGDYWKPVQSGTGEGSDTDTLRALLNLDDDRLHTPSYEFIAPLSPDQAARREGVKIRMDNFQPPASPRSLVVEGAGGLLVPLNDNNTMIDLIARLGLPVILVARSTLGTINHTLLSLEALAARSLPLVGVVVNGPSNPANVEAIRYHGRIKVIVELENIDPLDGDTLRNAAQIFHGVFNE